MTTSQLIRTLLPCALAASALSLNPVAVAQDSRPNVDELFRQLTGVDIAAVGRAAPPPAGNKPIITFSSLPGTTLDYSETIQPSGAVQADLFTYAAGAVIPEQPINPGVDRVEAVSINWRFLDALAPGKSSRVRMPLSNAEALELVLVQGEYFGADDFVWIGKIAGVPASDVILVRVEDSMRLVVRDYTPEQFGGRFYEIENVRGVQHALTTRSPHTTDSCGVTANTPGPAPVADQPQGRGGDDGGLAGGVDDPGNVIDLMVVASNQAKGGYGTPSAFVADCRARVADLNLRTSNSGGPWSYRLCAAEWNLISYDESGDMSLDLQRLAYVDGQWADTNENGVQDPGEELDPDGYMDVVQQQRSTYRPDLIHMMLQNGGSNGVGYVLETTNGAIGTGYAVTKRTVEVSGGTFAHEVGHNMGLCHNIEESATCTMLNHGHGIADTCSALEEFRTTLSYTVCGFGCTSTRIPYFSVTGLVVQQTLFGVVVCTATLWDQNTAREIDAANASRTQVARYNTGVTQVWTQCCVANGNGTYLDPFNSVRHGVLNVQGGVAEGVVKARSATYNETGAAGGQVVLSNPCKIEAVGGPVTLQ